MSDWQKAWQAASEGLKFLRREGDATIYEVSRTKMANGSFVRERRVTTTHASERVVWASDWRETLRFACHCCSCDQDYYTGHVTTDAYCRNHGFYGERPCEHHNLPGVMGDEDTEMPESVQAVNKRHHERDEKLKAEHGSR